MSSFSETPFYIFSCLRLEFRGSRNGVSTRNPETKKFAEPTKAARRRSDYGYTRREGGMIGGNKKTPKISESSK